MLVVGLRIAVNSLLAICTTTGSGGVKKMLLLCDARKKDVESYETVMYNQHLIHKARPQRGLNIETMHLHTLNT